MIFQLILPVLLTPTTTHYPLPLTTHHYSHHYSLPPTIVLRTRWPLLLTDCGGQSNLYQTWYDYRDFLWSPPDMVSVLFLDSRKYGHNQIYLYIKWSEKLRLALYLLDFSIVILWGVQKIKSILQSIRRKKKTDMTPSSC